ncbi:HAD-IIA family hydrolase [Paenibacillus sp. GYB004]|uniref:HAD-IIA family hydrolase n=1 Tax=Paenibacillus sp. GYB004 TaxID=2994393 RepID=UPI002F968F10
MLILEDDERSVSAALELLLQAEAVFFDLDGCIYFGDRLADGALALLEWLSHKGKQVRFVTNNSTDTGAQVAARLVRMGLKAGSEQIMTATELIGLHLMRLYGRTTLKVIGSRSLHSALERAGHRLVPLYSDERADTLVIGRDTSYDYAKLQAAMEEIDAGTPVLATNPDLFHPGSRGEKVPETGALYSALEAMTGRKINYFGKPAPYMFELAMENCGVKSPELCVMVGDNLHTDIAGGRSAGMKTIWLYDAANLPSSEEPLPFHLRPDVALPDLQSLSARVGFGGV